MSSTWAILQSVLTIVVICSAVHGLSVIRNQEHNDEMQNFGDVAQSLVEEDHGVAGVAIPKVHRANFAQRRQERQQQHLDLNELSRRRRATGGSAGTPAKGKECRTRAGEKGHCTRYQNCKGPELKESVWSILQHLCVVEGISVGICCPDVVQDGSGPEFSARLPAMADSYDDVDGLGDGPMARDGGIRPEERGCGLYEHDIAMLKLIQPSFFNSYIWPICMPPLDDSWNGYQAVVTGWGTQFFGGPHSAVLMEVKIPIWSNAQCQEVYVNRIYNTTLCAGEYDGGKDSCQGDSGGPLMIQLPNRRWAAVGIVSWGIRCGEANHPGIYTRVSSYVRWIVENAVF
uniref:Peptidase S1 domain-containing protein n=1 Tax=Anopheles dirus TaxID=7168 RepID=A0A182NA50_9DIPT